MKRLFILLLCVSMLLSVSAISVAAIEKPLSTKGELVNRTTLPDKDTRLNMLNLTSSPHYSNKTTAGTSTWQEAVLSPDQIADIADHSKYGVSVRHWSV